MSDDTGEMDPRVAEQTTKNIDLFARFLEEVLADPDRLDRIPDETTLVLLPPDDPDLAATNLAIGARLAEEGAAVRIERVGEPEPAAKTRRAAGSGVRRSRAK